MPLSSDPGSWTDSELEKLRQVGDPPADDMIARVFADGDVTAVNQVLTHFLDNSTDHTDVSPLPLVVRDFLQSASALPAWADQTKIAMAEGLFLEQGPLIFIALACASLPECYINGNEAQVLGVTNRLKGRRAYRRIQETAQLIVDVLASGAFTTTRSGIVATQRVRILHAGMRHLILKAKPSEAPASDDPLLKQLPGYEAARTAGLPINQEDLAYTLCTFSYVVLRSLGILGVAITQNEKDAYVHCWGIVGYLIGVRDDLIPIDFAHAEALFNRIKAHVARATKEGSVLAQSLETYMGEVLDSPWIGRRACIVLMRTLLDKDTAVGLGIGGLSVLDRLLALLFRLLVRDVQQLQGDVGRTDLRPLLQWAEERLVDGLTAMRPAWQGRLFAVPTEIKSHWSARKHAVS
jgi:hypothetical protein